MLMMDVMVIVMIAVVAKCVVVTNINRLFAPLAYKYEPCVCAPRLTAIAGTFKTMARIGSKAQQNFLQQSQVMVMVMVMVMVTATLVLLPMLY
jgi:hypothetical protein